jgi:hypothetical protein
MMITAQCSWEHDSPTVSEACRTHVFSWSFYFAVVALSAITSGRQISRPVMPPSKVLRGLAFSSHTFLES